MNKRQYKKKKKKQLNKAFKQTLNATDNFAVACHNLKKAFKDAAEAMHKIKKIGEKYK